jgi:Zn-dependent protease with chaperone function
VNIRKTSFFSRQERLRRVTRRLLFLTAIGAIGVGSLGGLAVALVNYNLAYESGTAISWTVLAPNAALGAALTLTLSTLVVFYRLLVLHFSRSSVRRFFKARDISDESQLHDLASHDRQLLNIVEEMAIASSTPMPHVFVLDDDASINSFALVQSRERGTIGVTAGARDHLSRDELQAIVAHELAHISNGDAAINMRLLALIQGFRWIYDTSVAVIGAPFKWFDSFKFAFFVTFYLTILFGAFYVLGLFGVGVARLMQAAIARQREYLADASAVQFTRLTAGLLGALEKADAFRQNRRREPTKIAAFMMFVSPYRARSWLLRTHPTIEQRIEAARAMTPGTEPDGLINGEELDVERTFVEAR